MSDAATPETLRSILETRIGTYPDFPTEGVLFRDVTPLLADAAALRVIIKHWCSLLPPEIDVVVGTEARGFMFGAPLAYELGAGFVPVRKAGKLPGSPRRVEYELEYGTAAVEIPEGALLAGQRVLVLDDLLATGGTAGATLSLVREAGAEVVGASFLIELEGLGGREVLGSTPITSVWSIPN